ncbi:2-oxoglutaramate amidase [Streptomyces violaceorubidus]
MRASLIQIAVNEDETVEARRRRAAALVREQAGADLVVLPELWTTGAFAFEEFDAAAEPLRGPTYEAMAKAASDAGVWLHAGSVPERGPDGRLYNTSLVLSPSGEPAASYRKIHRFGFDKGEAVLMGAGREPVTVRLPDTTLGLATCYDLRFPELFRSLVDAGAEILVVPAGWPERRRSAGRSWRRPGPWRTRRSSSPVERPGRTRGLRRPVTRSWWTPGARCSRRRVRTRRCSRWSSTRSGWRGPGSSSRP